MKQYISKDALVAEIGRLITPECGYSMNKLLDFIESLEVKEVDLDFTKEVDVWVRDNEDTNGFFNVQELAKHFFELGLKAQKGE